MPVIKVFSRENSAEEHGNRSHPAAAVMACFLASSSQPSQGQEMRKSSRAEETRPGNPNRLTLNQHVFPTQSIKRFTTERGRVSVRDLRAKKLFLAKPDNAIFCARRAWDQRAETGYMKRIEDEFQRIGDAIASGEWVTLPSEHKRAVDRMYALWYMRSRHRELESQEIQLNGIAGDNLSKEMEENLEKNTYLFAREGGTMPRRQLNGVEIQLKVGWQAQYHAENVTRWGVIRAQSGDFIVPDVPGHGIIPITPQLALVTNAPDGMITECNLAQINRAMGDGSQGYFFGRDLAACPF